MKIYTKTGDKGTTRLVDGRECSKSDLRVETYGTVDELNSILGVAASSLLTFENAADFHSEILEIQNQLFTVGCHLACEKESVRKNLPVLDDAWITALEKKIDVHTEKLPALKNFILPGGSRPAAELHQARTVCRRAERMVVRLIEDRDTLAAPENETSLRYLNRLSDYLFTVARAANQKLKTPDQEWKK